MIFDKTQPYKNVDGKDINLSADELTQLAIGQAKYITETNIDNINKQISSLQAQQTSDVVRNAILGDKTSIDALQDIEDQITALRSQLTQELL